jgi:hypothetical protein
LRLEVLAVDTCDRGTEGQLADAQAKRKQVCHNHIGGLLRYSVDGGNDEAQDGPKIQEEAAGNAMLRTV